MLDCRACWRERGQWREGKHRSHRIDELLHSASSGLL
jgi:hypothetical protein